MNGEVVHIHIGPEAEGPMEPVTEVNAVAGRGLEGDRYFAKEGSFSDNPGGGREVTLVAAEAIEALEREHGIKLAPGDTRRNITTRGIALNDLVGRDFKAGDAVLRGVRLCQPCAHLERLTGRDGIIKGLANRGGLRCDIITTGTIRRGDPVG